jgi:hypothetical protein
MGKGRVVGLGLLVGASLSGCPQGAELEDAMRFIATAGGSSAGSAGTGVSGSSGAGGAGSTFVPPACDYRGVLRDSCGNTTCHETTPSRPPAAGLDLESDGVEARVLGQPASHAGIVCNVPGGVPQPCLPPGCDPTHVLVKPGDPAGSYLLHKVAGTHGDCGLTMPILPGKLDASGRACLEAWVEALANSQ